MAEGNGVFPPENLKAEFDGIVARYPKKTAALIPIMMRLQEEFQHITTEDMDGLATYLDTTPAHVLGVLTFYTMFSQKKRGKHHIYLCKTLSCHMRGAAELLALFEEKLGVKAHSGEATEDGEFSIDTGECLGVCEQAPCILVDDKVFGNITPEMVDQIIAEVRGMSLKPTNILLLGMEKDLSGSIDTYISDDGYKALEKALKEMKPEEVIAEVAKARIRGRGGAGFEAGRKWGFLPKNNTKPVYLACNADESEPGTFKDRHIMEHCPHRLIEGCLLACYAIGSKTGYIYVRGEFPGSQQALWRAIDEAREKGFMGENILGTDFCCEIYVHTGAGAYVCGEETGMLSSIEGGRGHPRLKPPFPAVEGLFRCPTIVNNVETLANVPFVIHEGADAFLALGTDDTPGPKLFCVSGHVEKPGCYEFESGANLKELLEHCGGVWKGRQLKGVIPGGASAHILKPDEIDVAMDFGSMAKAGSILGSAGMVVVDDQTCIVELLRNALEFFAHESCGQCTPCREGTGWVRKIAARLEAGEGTMEDIDKLWEVADNFEGMGGKTICALADAAAWPTKSYVEKFRDEFEEHVRLGRCPMKG